MKVPANIFREYDIRGVAERDLTNEVARGIGRGLATLLPKGTASGDAGVGASHRGGPPLRLAVGRDCRVSSPRLFEALTGGLVEQGVQVIDIGVGPTPYLYSAVHMLDVDGGVMITGSHNAGDENGFKMMRGKASFYGADIQTLRACIESEAFAVHHDGDNVGGSISQVDHRGAYVRAITEGIKLATTDMKIVVDAGNGSGGPLGIEAMEHLGLKPDPLFCDMDGTFPNHHPDPTVPKNLDALIARVRETGARVGIAFDGDADRIGAVDANGDIIWGDKLLILFARDVLKANPGAAVLGEVKCSQTLYDDIAKHGGRPIMWKTGHSLIKTKMKEEHALLAGEMSGHVFFADRYKGYDDAIYASLRLLEILSNDPRSIGEMLADVPKTFTTPELRVDCPDNLKAAVVKSVLETYEKRGLSVISIDGARISFGTPEAPAWGLVRASNTGPILVMRFEAGSEAERDRIRAEVEGVVTAARQALSGSQAG